MKRIIHSGQKAADVRLIAWAVFDLELLYLNGAFAAHIFSDVASFYLFLVAVIAFGVLLIGEPEDTD